jgi:hypothetical protein
MRGWKCSLCLFWTLAIAVTSCGPSPTPPLQSRIESTGPSRVRSDFASTPLTFEENHGQTNPAVKFLAHARDAIFFVTSTETVLLIDKPDGRPTHDVFGKLTPAKRPGTRVALRTTLVGGAPATHISGSQRVAGRSNFLIGRDPAKWQRDIPAYARVNRRNVYPGIDVTYHGTQRQLEYDFVVSPGADPTRILMRFEGAKRLELDSAGDLVLETAVGFVRQQRPFAYQEFSGVRRAIPASYALLHDHDVAIALGAYDHGFPVTIDPVIAYSTYLGGTGTDIALGVTVDAAGSAYITGFTLAAADFPTTAGAFDRTFHGFDVFVTKLDPAGSALEYSTYIGGSGIDVATGITIDADGNAFIAGNTQSPDFPATPGAFDTTFNGVSDAFLTKLAPDGSALVYSTFLGGAGIDNGFGVAVDDRGQAFVGGATASVDFPVTAGAFDTSFNGEFDAFVTKLDQSGSALVYSTFIGSPGFDAAFALAVGTDGRAYITGQTNSSAYPTTTGAAQIAFGGDTDAIVTRLNRSGSDLDYSTFLGGSGHEDGFGIAVDDRRRAIVTGSAGSLNFPTTAGAFRTSFGGGLSDAFVTAVNGAGTAFVYSTLLGGTGDEFGIGAATDQDGRAAVVGRTTSADFSTTPNATDPTFNGDTDAFVATFSRNGLVLESTFFGGTGFDEGRSVFLRRRDRAYVAGFSLSSDLPTTATSFSPTFNGGTDVFVTTTAIR